MDRIRYYVDGRLFEWSMTVPMLALSILSFIWPLTLRGSAFRWILAVGSPIGLLLNGHTVRGIRVGPVIRSVTAVARAVMWVQFALALLRLSIIQGYPSPGLPFWLMFTVTELYVAYRAVAGNGRTS